MGRWNRGKYTGTSGNVKQARSHSGDSSGSDGNTTELDGVWQDSTTTSQYSDPKSILLLYNMFCSMSYSKYDIFIQQLEVFISVRRAFFC